MVAAVTGLIRKPSLGMRLYWKRKWKSWCQEPWCARVVRLDLRNKISNILFRVQIYFWSNQRTMQCHKSILAPYWKTPTYNRTKFYSDWWIVSGKKKGNFKNVIWCKTQTKRILFSSRLTTFNMYIMSRSKNSVFLSFSHVVTSLNCNECNDPFRRNDNLNHEWIYMASEIGSTHSYEKGNCGICGSQKW